jgi:O-antigen/teichoic acid export membrane protein
LISAVIDISWFFFGIEKFQITLGRNLIIKLFSLIMIFIFVKKENDLWKYTLIMSAGMLFSQVYLWFFIKKYIDFKSIKLKKVLRHFKPCVLLFIPVVSYSIYKVMDKTMLGAIAGTLQLGYYENAEKILNIPTSLVVALGTVTLPAMSKIIYEKNNYLKKIYENFKISFCFIVPMTFGIMAVSKDFSILYFGEKFAESGEILFLLAPTLLLDAISCVIRTCYLIPQNKEHIYIRATILGAMLNFFVNSLLIPEWGYFGACIGTIAAVLSMMAVHVFYIRKIISIPKIFNILSPFLLKAVSMLIVIFLIGKVIQRRELRVPLQIVFGVLSYIMLNLKFLVTEFWRYKKE